ncbi:hypothetical protein NDU88_004617 [Pleurodeles waltl]|uniref:Uncharacterized protein n=1 Tax=Pleurodeles waltl TaxID=8319 RepID=A0AAV7TSG4_PLEWA|nr:hypothetical protein NDU88_004617 [Pleurodeles waltl]
MREYNSLLLSALDSLFEPQPLPKKKKALRTSPLLRVFNENFLLFLLFSSWTGQGPLTENQRYAPPAGRKSGRKVFGAPPALTQLENACLGVPSNLVVRPASRSKASVT